MEISGRNELKRLSSDDIGKELDRVEVTAVRLIFSRGEFVIFACRGGYTVKGKYGGAVTGGVRYLVSGKVTSYQDKPQISASEIEIIDETDTEQSYIAAFLADNFNGIGERTAEKLAERYGRSILETIKYNDGDIKAEFPNIDTDVLIEAAELIDEDFDRLSEILKLRLLGFSNGQASGIYGEFGEDSEKRIRENPYILMKLSGFGFETCDRIARRMNSEPLSISRFAGATVCAVTELHEENGDSYLLPEEVRRRTFAILSKNTGGDMPDELFDGMYHDAVVRAVEDKIITVYRFMEDKCVGCDVDDEGARIARREYFGTEAAIKKEIESFISAGTVMPDEEKTRGMIRKLGREDGIALDRLQEDAVFMCMYSPIAIITGGPGTGKTTITSILARHFKNKDIKFEFCAPTGRAAKRLSEASGVPASTIHRLLEMSAPSDEDDEAEERVYFGRNRSNPLDARVVVADEASMIDMFLFKALLDSLKPGSSLILVGDPDQLPSVGAGNILADLISCPAIPCVRLKYIFRQENEGTIAANAVRILKGEYPVPGDDFEIIHTASDDEAVPLIAEKGSWFEDGDFAILSPTRKGVLGTVNLNGDLQMKLNSGNEDGVAVRPDLKLYQGDIVMQVKNNYSIEFYNPSSGEVQRGVFNGEIGRFEGYSALSGEYDIIFDGDRKIGYGRKEIGDIELAYAITVHKAQGCEFDRIAVVLGNMNYKLSNRRLLYTAVTRGKKKVTIIDSGGRLSKMLGSGGDFMRKTSLPDFLKIVAGRYGR